MHRTITTARDTFALPEPNEVTFEFPRGPGIVITVPKNSNWRMPLHWHYHKLDARSIHCLSGRLHVEVTNDSLPLRSIVVKIRPCESHDFHLGQLTSWRKDAAREGEDSDSELVIILMDANETLHRNICSATLDRDIFPFLTSTPLIIQLLFCLARLIKLQHPFLQAALWIQLQMIYYAHDMHISHGDIDIFPAWFYITLLVPRCTRVWKPPPWMQRFRRWSERWISWVVMGSCSWLGKTVLGMQAEYQAYSSPRVRTPICGGRKH